MYFSIRDIACTKICIFSKKPKAPIWEHPNLVTYYLLQKVKTYTWKPVIWMLLFHNVFITINILKRHCTLHCYRPVSTNPMKQSTNARTWCCSETPELMGTWELVPTQFSRNFLFHFWCFIWSFKKISWIWGYVPTKFLNSLRHPCYCSRIFLPTVNVV